MIQDLERIREPSHAGSWYTDNGKLLNQQLDNWLGKASKQLTNVQRIKAIIGPHAGFDYSAATAAWAYQYLSPSENYRVFLLGPCHHQYIKGIGISSLDIYRTPLGDIELDRQTINEIVKNVKQCYETTKEVEEEEHSLEMHLPFIQKLLQGKKFKLVPIMIGNTDIKYEDYIGKFLAKYFDDINSLFIISSDFCHWGKRFQYVYYNKEDGEIHQSIEKLDRKAIEYIETYDTAKYYKYLEQTQNTICGRHPIGILLNIINNSTLKGNLKTKLTSYNQSNRVQKTNESSVSYSAIVTYY